MTLMMSPTIANRRYRDGHPSQRMRLASGAARSLADAAIADLLAARSRAQQSPDSEIAWAAGLFEGEGCFGFDKVRESLRATVVMGDKDVLDRFAAAVGIGNVSGGHGKTNPRHRTMWRWQASGTAVIEMALLFWPYLGERRRATFSEKMAAREAFINRATCERGCPSCGQSFRPPFTRMASRVRYCSDVCSQRGRRARRAC